ncbi:protein phosphatase 2C [Trypanosoma grayi]|uniref:protein phosphatase 2C n=1 Tax=Trypanosoma grayi TaxID=71804 RepID=UPI0004F4860C|nr:protein phosphatase 2C [Trypanosoma grayi]KEG06416.1 protein phosphatase 2C [Trypanosoma grayi]
MQVPTRLLGCGDERLLSFYYRCVQFLPHPAKQQTGGEDAFLSLVGVQAVLDGVSWWKTNRSVDAGLYSAALAKAMHSYVEEDLFGENPASSLEVMQHAYNACMLEEIEGTATALVATLQEPRSGELPSLQPVDGYKNCILDVCSVGDCTAMVLRHGRIVFVSDEQTHDLDFPYQLGKGSSDTPERALNYRVPVEVGDMLLLGSDGVFDNLYPHRVAELVWTPVRAVHMKHMRGAPFAPRPRGGVELFEDMMHAIASGSEDVMREARGAARDIRTDTPYAHKAVAGGAYYEGGKQDDMTLLVSVIDDASDASLGERLIRGAALNPYPYRDWP